MHIALAALRHLGIPTTRASAAVQGFGNVGAGTAQFLWDAGVKVTAVSDQYGAIYASEGLEIGRLRGHVAETGSVVGFTGGTEFPAENLLELEVDLLVPAAVEGVLNADNATRVRGRVIVEGANGPTTTAADLVFKDRDILVVPDILANAGGVIVSYFEWVQGHQAYWWTAAEVDERLKSRMDTAWNSLVASSAAGNLTLREAATVIAVEKVAEAHLIRGLYP